MRLRFTKMQGAGNDFVVLDATREPLELTPERLRFLGDRRFGVGADQILVVGTSNTPGVDFSYRIFNNTGDEVEQCGNGARCFVRYVHDKGLTSKQVVRVETINSLIELQLQADGRVKVDMNRPIFEPALVPFDDAGLSPRSADGRGADKHDGFGLWPLTIGDATLEVAVLSMGNPHAVQRVDDVETAPVVTFGPLVEHHHRFPRRVNAGFMQVVARNHIKLRVYERDAGETLACGTGACAAVVAGIRLGWLDAVVEVDTHGGRLTIEWQGGDAPVLMTGPAVSVFEGEIEIA